MVAPGRDFVVAPFFEPKIGENQKKRFSSKNQWAFSPNEDGDGQIK